MKIHEYQAKRLLAEKGIPIPRGEVANTPEEVRKIAESLGGSVVVKAQIHAGGRGKGGGIKTAATPEEAFERASEIIGMTLVTPQTGPEGKKVRAVLVEEMQEIERELYLAIVMDRATAAPVIIASAAGGMEIEEVAATSPEKIVRQPLHPTLGYLPFMGRNLAKALGFPPQQRRKAAGTIEKLYRVFIDNDASLAEINPWIVTKSGENLALDAKVNLDDNALFRHPELSVLRDFAEEDPLEVEASKYHLNYIRLDGSVGCMVNGAGLAMATMDLIKLAGSEPANFLDVGGGASVERISAAFRILMSDPKVRAVLVNIFGGIVRCDRVAQGIIESLGTVEVNVPIVVRLEGTNAREARERLEASSLDFIIAQGLEDAAQKVVAAEKAHRAGEGGEA